MFRPTADSRKRFCSSSTSRAKTALAAVMALFLISIPGSVLTDEPSTDVIRVEEDWELHIGLPDPDTNGPQIQNTFSVREDLNGDYAVWEINHASQPSYRRGGMQLQLWRYDSIDHYRDFEAGTMLSLEDETIHYTLSAEIKDGRLRFAVANGTSDSWGTFGTSGDGESCNSVSHETNLTNLNTYRTETSLANSGINYASHRVKRFSIREVRYYSSSGLIRRESQERVVHSSGVEE
ncbi:MAG: hypothetical protein KDA68_04180 [Planctomycetaceae bacterium]|nr:hypothetical protein [Planctomycetaceae bacterium]